MDTVGLLNDNDGDGRYPRPIVYTNAGGLVDEGVIGVLI
jgi:hypothetical protein